MLFATCFTLVSTAQTESGTKFIGLNDCLSITKLSTTGGISGGYFLSSRLALAGGITFSKIGEDAEMNTSIALGARYYMGKFFPMVMYDFAGEGKMSFGAGYRYMMTDNLALEPVMNIGMGSEDDDEVDLDLKVGFALYW